MFLSYIANKQTQINGSKKNNLHDGSNIRWKQIKDI